MLRTKSYDPRQPAPEISLPHDEAAAENTSHGQQQLRPAVDFIVFYSQSQPPPPLAPAWAQNIFLWFTNDECVWIVGTRARDYE